MRRTVFPAALLLVLSTFASACAHQSADAATAEPMAEPMPEAEPASEPESELDEPESELDEPDSEAGPNVISFDDHDGGPVDVIAAPPKREELPSFELFGTGDKVRAPGPQLTLPPGVE